MFSISDIHGKVTLNLSFNAGTSKTFHALVYILLPSGDMVADTAKYCKNVLKGFKNKVSFYTVAKNYMNKRVCDKRLNLERSTAPHRHPTRR